MSRVAITAFAVFMAWASVAAAAPTLQWSLVATRPHDAGAWTQGLVAYRGELLESTGDCCDPARQESSVRRIDPLTGQVTWKRQIRGPQYTEGLAVLGGYAWQLTWMDNVAYRLSLPGLRQVQAIPYPRQGWGLTSHRGRLLASDGSATLRWLSRPRLRVTRSVVVRDGARPVFNLNELEVVGQHIWANLWQEDRIAIIRPGDGRVLAYVDLSPLRQRLGRPGDVLNGIARDPVTGDVLVTGKFWDRMFVIRLDEPVPA